MRSRSALWLLVAALVSVASPSGAKVLGETNADGKGAGKIEFKVETWANEQALREDLEQNVEITENGRLRSIDINDGIVTLEFDGANPKSLVEALIADDELVGYLPGESSGGPPTAALAAGGGAFVGGVGYGIYQALDKDDEDEQPTGTPVE